MNEIRGVSPRKPAQQQSSEDEDDERLDEIKMTPAKIADDDQPPDAFLIVRSSNGQSEVHEINQRNFELFGKPLESGAKLTASSVGDSEAAK